MEVDPVSRPFNTPLEAGLRSLFLLQAAGRASLGSDRLVYYDYVLVHSADLGGPKSLHPASPSQTGELLVRRALIQDGLALMRSRDLVIRRFASTGITYAITAPGRHVAEHFESAYAVKLREVAEWVAETFKSTTDRKLSALLRQHVADWDDELIADAQPMGADS